MRRASCLLLVGIVGCTTPAPSLRTPVPEQMTLPPEDDPRYSKPVEYPKELLNKPPVKPAAPGGGPSGGPRTPMTGAGGMPPGM